jgi:hypothetical protein
MKNGERIFMRTFGFYNDTSLRILLPTLPEEFGNSIHGTTRTVIDASGLVFMIRETGDKTDGSCRAENQLIATLR